MKLSMAFSPTAMELYLGQRALCLVEQLIILARVGFMKSKDFPTFTKQPHNSNIVVRPYVEGRECSPPQRSTQPASQQHV